MLGEPAPSAAIQAQHQIDLERAKQSNFAAVLERVREDREVITDELECLKKRDLGQSCSIFPGFPPDNETKPSIAALVQRTKPQHKTFKAPVHSGAFSFLVQQSPRCILQKCDLLRIF